MTKKRKIILISLAVTLALSVGVGGFVYAVTNGNNNYVNNYLYEHQDVGGNKLLGVGEMGYEYEESYYYPVVHHRSWDTQFIITNPNCDKPLYIEWIALIDSDEYVIAEGTPGDWQELIELWWESPPGTWDKWLEDLYDDLEACEELSGHETIQLSIAQLFAAIGAGGEWYSGTEVREYYPLDKYTVEVTWSGARYTGWWWWGYWRSGRPLTGWAKEKCWNWFEVGYTFVPETLNMAISEAEMKVFPSRTRFEPGEPYFPLF